MLFRSLKCQNGFIEHIRNAQFETNAFEAAFPMAVNNYVIPDKTDVDVQEAAVLQGLSAVQTNNNSVSLTWNAYPDAGSFYLYRAAAGEGYYCIGITTEDSYHNEVKPGMNYRYRVYARKNGQTIASSEEISLTTQTMLPKKGTVCRTKDGYRYKVLSATSESKKVAFAGVSDKNVKKVIGRKSVV